MFSKIFVCHAVLVLFLYEKKLKRVAIKGNYSNHRYKYSKTRRKEILAKILREHIVLWSNLIIEMILVPEEDSL